MNGCPDRTARTGDTDARRLRYLIDHYPLAMLMAERSAPMMAYAPMATVRETPLHDTDKPVGGLRRLYGHLDRGDPMLPALDGGAVKAAFLGPNGYVPAQDVATRQSPGWHFSCAEVSGATALVDDMAGKKALMIDFLRRMEGTDRIGIDPDGPEFNALLRRLCFFTLDIHAVSGRFSLAQDLPLADRRKAADGLRARIGATLDETLDVLAGLR